ncbi:MAG: multiphosphoryl transfer protein, partial [Frankiales bacterium]|nr:multiphosphoryl transfer protein [Frankiales bacterium]
MPDQAATVGLVLVCHSRPLALAAVDLASEMLHGRPLRLAVAAGLDETTFGTDAVRIGQAIEEVDGPAGVVVLMDLGSAVLSAELALDLLSDQAVRERVVLSPAAVVEGLVVAAVAAAGGASRTEVAAEARDALLAKASHLTEAPAEPPTEAEVAAEASGTFVVTNPHGLHARPAARLVGELRGFDASVTLRNLTTGAGPVPGSSLSRVATLAALQGHSVEVRA